MQIMNNIETNTLLSFFLSIIQKKESYRDDSFLFYYKGVPSFVLKRYSK